MQELNMKLFCPILGLQIHTQDGWLGRKLGDDFTANFYRVGQSVLYSGPSGIADLRSAEAVLQLSAEVSGKVADGTGPYIQIEDYALLSGATIEARKHFVTQMVSRDRLMAVIFCNLSPMLQFFVKIGKRFNTTDRDVYVVRDYKEAILLAHRLCHRHQLKTGPFVFGKQVTYRDGGSRLTPPKLFSKGDWNIQTDSYTHRSFLIDRCILHSVTSGFIREADVPLVDDMRCRVREHLSAHEEIRYIMGDVSALRGGSRKARQLYMKSLKEWSSRFPFRMYILYGANPFMRTAARLASPVMPFKVMVAKDMDHAFQLIQNDHHPNNQEKQTPESDPIQEYQEELLAYIGGIDWEREGFGDFVVTEDESHPFYDVFQAIKLIKNEVDDLFRTQREIQGRLEKSEKKYRELFEKGSDLLCTHGLDGTLMETNLAFKRGYGWAGELPPGRNIRDFIVKKYRHEFDEYLDRIQRQGHDEGTMVAATAEGREIILEYHNVLVRDDTGRPMFVQGSARDITDRVEAERKNRKLEEQLKQKQKIEAIATLTGGIAHDYNNLLSIIMGNLSMAMEDVKRGSSLEDLLKAANEASLKVRDLTHELMALSKGGDPVKEIGSLWKLLKEVSDSSLERDGISLKESISRDLWPIPYDPYKMGAVFRNVLANAVEAMPDGGSLNIKAENLRVEDTDPDSRLPLLPGDYVHVSIQDQGVGIPREHLEKIFDPYFSTKALGVQKGMGLGLSTSYAIVHKHGGHMAVDSTPGLGTTVDIYLPVENRSEKIQGNTPSQDTSLPPMRRLLLMDDEEMMRKMAPQMLKRQGYAVETVKDGVEAIEAYQKQQKSGNPFDAVILDLTIKGGMGGEQTIGELMKIDPNIKAIVSSGYFNDPVMSDFKKYGFTGRIAKPYGMNTLKKALEKLFV